MIHDNPFAQAPLLFCCTLRSEEPSELLMDALYELPYVVSVSMDVVTGTVDITPVNAPTLWRVYATCDDAQIWEQDCQMIGTQWGKSLQMVSLEPLEERDWVRETQQYIQPLHVGMFSILGSHHPDDEAPHGAHRIRLDAGAAFGTGEHATTSSCLRAIAHVNRYHRVMRALDVGCGTGILAMAQAKIMPSSYVLAVDNDPVAVKVTKENIRRNQLHGQIHAYVANGLAHNVIRQNAPYDLIIANILARPVRSMAGAIARNLAPDGYVILSGFYEHSLRFVMARYTPHGFHLHEVMREGAWVALILTR
ncbi:MAG: 50S ribosomal protein L11 methyltransferase [Alphaproteobacteria bacterium]|nr:MAG: 50S ribosomal protein L11 methyltransferase [Alphaproteobacteria bacterium]